MKTRLFCMVVGILSFVGCAAHTDEEGDDAGDEPVGEVEQASANGCTAAPFGYVCIDVEGSGLNVRRVSAVRGKGDPSFICNYAANYTVRYPNGRVVTSSTQRSKNGACSPGRAWFDWNGNWKYPHGTKVCVHFYEGGQKQGGSPCITIKR